MKKSSNVLCIWYSPRAGNQPAGAGGVPANSQANTGHNAQQPINPMENMLFSFLNDLITGLSGGGVTVGGVGGGGGIP